MRLEERSPSSPARRRAWARRRLGVSARKGAKVVVADMLEEEGKAVADSINATGGKAMFMRAERDR